MDDYFGAEITSKIANYLELIMILKTSKGRDE